MMRMFLVMSLAGYVIWLSTVTILFFSFTLLQELISIKSLIIYNIVFTLKVRYDLNCVKSAVKLQPPQRGRGLCQTMF